MSETRELSTPGGVRIAWDELGSGPSVVLIHGLGSSRRRWRVARQVLSDAGFRALRYDLRGFGESSPAERPHGMDELVADLECFVDGVAPGGFHLVGHSLGGMLAQRYAIAHPDRVASLVLASTTSHNGRRASAFAEAMVILSEHGFDAALGDPAERPRLEHALAEAFPGGPPPLDMLRVGLEDPDPARANAWRACIGFSTKGGLGRLSCPVLVMHGSADPLIPFRAGQLIHEAVPASEWLAEDGAGHSLPTQRAESFNRALIDFLRRSATRDPGV